MVRLRYMSPEQIRHEEVDQRTDLFALGATLIEVLTGERIFEGNSYADCAKKILAFNIEMLDQFTEQSSVEFVRFLKLLMAPKKQNRFVSSKDALNAFDEKDSNISIDASDRHSSSVKRLFSVLSGIAILIIAIIFFLPNRISDSKHMIQTKAFLNIDSNSISRTIDSNLKPNKDTSIRGVSKPIQKILTSKPEVVLSNVTNQTATDSGTVIFTSTPWAKVYVDSNCIGETPLSKPLIVAAGKHLIWFVNPSFDPITQTITVLPFRECVVTANFLDNVGYLNCLATPWAKIYINDQYEDTTPLEKPIMLSPGKYQVRFKNTYFRDIVREVTVRSKDTTSIVISFKGQ